MSGRRYVRSLGCAAGLLAVVAGAAGCAGEDGSAEPAPGSSTPRSAQPRPEDADAARRAVRESWRRFFDPGQSADDKTEVLEDGEQLQLLLSAFNDDQRRNSLRGRVSRIRFTSAGRAEVDYSVSRRGATALPEATGSSVLQDGQWRVSVETLCRLVELSGEGPKAPGC